MPGINVHFTEAEYQEICEAAVKDHRQKIRHFAKEAILAVARGQEKPKHDESVPLVWRDQPKHINGMVVGESYPCLVRFELPQ